MFSNLLDLSKIWLCVHSQIFNLEINKQKWWQQYEKYFSHFEYKYSRTVSKTKEKSKAAQGQIQVPNKSVPFCSFRTQIKRLKGTFKYSISVCGGGGWTKMLTCWHFQGKGVGEMKDSASIVVICLNSPIEIWISSSIMAFFPTPQNTFLMIIEKNI